MHQSGTTLQPLMGEVNGTIYLFILSLGWQAVFLCVCEGGWRGVTYSIRQEENISQKCKRCSNVREPVVAQNTSEINLVALFFSTVMAW